MFGTQIRLALVLVCVGTVAGILLLTIGAPIWAYYFAPLLTVPIVLVALWPSREERTQITSLPPKLSQRATR